MRAPGSAAILNLPMRSADAFMSLHFFVDPGGAPR